MTASSRSDGRLRLLIASLILSMALTSGAMAQDGSEIARLAEEARQAFLSAEQGNASSKQKAGFYQIARARLKLLEKFAGQGTSGSPELRDNARAELRRLADDGLSHDILSSMLLQASLGDLAGTQAGADRVEVGVTLHQLASEQRSPAYRAAAFIEIGYAFSRAGAQDRALRYAALALEAAQSIQDTGPQAGAYRAVARLAASLGAPGTSLASRAIGQIPQPRNRAYARHEAAREQLKGSTFEKVSETRIKVEAARRMGTGDLHGSASLILALSASEDRENLLSDLFAAAIRKQDRDVAIAAAQGFFESVRQQKALAVLVRDYADRGVPFQAAEIVNGMQDGPHKAAIQLILAAKIQEAGYGSMADRLLSSSLQIVKTLPEEERRALYPELVRSLSRAGRLSDALAYADRLDPGPEGPAILSELAERLADQGRSADAEALLPRIADRDRRDQVLSAVARAKAKAGDTAGALRLIGEIGDLQHIEAVFSALAQSRAASGDFAQALALAGRIGDTRERTETLAGIARQAVLKQNKEFAGKAVQEAVRTAAGQAAGSQDESILALVRMLADLGERSQAGELAQRIADASLRQRAEDWIVRTEVRDAVSQWKDARLPEALLKRSLARVTNDQDKVDLASDLAVLADGGIHAADLIRSIADDRLRRAAFRRLAERRSDFLATSPANSSSDPAVDVETVASVSGEGGETAQEIQTRRGLALLTLETGRPSAAGLRMPRRMAAAEDVRAKVPWPSGAVVGSTFAHHNPYIAKFLEDDAEGATRLEQAIRYQGQPSPRIIVVQSGVATLGMVARQLHSTDARDLIGIEQDALTIRAPIFVAPGATLILSRLDVPVYRLSVDAGAFIANAGEVRIIDADIVGYDEKAKEPFWADSTKAAQFRPFLLNWGDGRMDVASSVLSALGYDNPRSSGLSYSSGPDAVASLRDQTRPTGVVVDNVFRNLYLGFHSYEAERVQVVGNEFRDSIFYAVDAHDRSKGITLAFNTVYGTMLRHGITISRDVEDSVVVGNLSFDNAGSGIVLDRNSTNNVLQANSAFRNAQDGVTVFESSCNVLSSNYLASNKRDGLKVRNSIDIGAYGNRFEANAQSGVSAYIANILSGKTGESQAAEVFSPVTGLSLRNNRFSSNGVGINAQGASGLVMYGNHFVKQSRRLFGGDVRGLEGPVLRLTSQADVLIASTCRPVKPVTSCRLRSQGFFEGNSELQIFSSDGRSNCTDVNGTVQQRAFASSSQGT